MTARSGSGSASTASTEVVTLVGGRDDARRIGLAHVRDIDAVERRDRDALHPGAARARGPHQCGEPAREGFRLLEVRELAERRTERLLRGVRCAVPVARARDGHAEREVLESHDELGPRRVVAPLCRFDDRPQAQVLRHRAHHNSKEPVTPAMVTGRRA